MIKGKRIENEIYLSGVKIIAVLSINIA